MELLECEICGKRVSKLYKVEIEGSIAMVCEECKEYGREVKEDKGRKKREGVRRFVAKHYQYEEDDEVVIEGFGSKIRRSIERGGKSIEEFARMLGMKESYVRRIINEDITPTISEAQKIEKVLGIKLVERVKSEKMVNDYTNEENEKGRIGKEKTAEGLTLGDLLKDALRKRKSR